MNYRRAHFRRAAVVHGMRDLSMFEEVFPMGTDLDNHTLNAWLQRMLAVPKLSTFQGHHPPRLVNRFKLGADPEMVFVNPADRERVDGEALGLRQGRAFGADNNGRLVEIRPYPYRSAVDSLASMLAAMRWMMLTNPTTQGVEWHAGAYLFRDGLGGHVHVGRRRDTRTAEIKALDGLYTLMTQIGMFPMGEMKLRMAGDAHGQRYGLPGDFREQPHGYEYRSLPSWLDSPRLAFITMVLAKLAVFNPKLMQDAADCTVAPASQARKLVNLLAYYKPLDDDARLAYGMLTETGGIPRHKGGDFRERWGLTNYTVAQRQNVFVPSNIPIGVEDTEEMFGHLLFGTPLSSRVPVPAWNPTKIPEGFYSLLDSTSTAHTKGLGEIIWDLVAPTEIPFVLERGERASVDVGVDLARRLPPDWADRLQAAIVPSDKRQPLAYLVESRCAGMRIRIYSPLLEGKLAKVMRKALVDSKAFPIFKIEAASKQALAAWKAGFHEAKKEPKSLGKVICEL